VMQPSAVERVRERAHHVLLSDERSEILRPPLACENLIGHREIVSATQGRKDLPAPGGAASRRPTAAREARQPRMIQGEDHGPARNAPPETQSRRISGVISRESNRWTGTKKVTKNVWGCGGKLLKTARTNTRETTGEIQERKEEGDEPDPRHWWKTAVAASFPT